MKRCSALAVTLLAGLSVPAFAATLYVDDDAAPGGDGSQATPYQTIGEAVAAAQPDDVIDVAAGIYDEQVDPTVTVTLLGPNAGIDPNTGARGPEAIIRAIQHNTGNTDWNFDDFVLSNTNAQGLTVDGFTFEGFNPGVTGGGQTGVNGVDPVGAAAGVIVDASPFVFQNNVVQNFAQFPVYGFGEDNTFTNNLIQNNGIPNVLGFGRVIFSSANSYGNFDNNTFDFCRGALQFQGQDTASAVPATVRDNMMTNMEGRAIFINVFSGSANDFEVTGNTITGIPGRGSSGIDIVSQEDGATPRRHTFTDNDISGFSSAYNFANNDTVSQRISGGTVDNCDYVATFSNRFGYDGFIEYSGDLSGIDGAGGPAFFNSAVATATLEAGLTAPIILPDGSDDANGQTAFSASDFTGGIALLLCDLNDDFALAAANAEAAGAEAVIIGYNVADDNQAGRFSPPERLDGSPEVDIPTTSIDREDYDALFAEIDGGGSVSATLNNFAIPTSSYGVASPAVVGSAGVGTLVNVEASNIGIAGFAVFDIPNSIGLQGSTPGPLTGEVIGGSAITDSPFGVLIVGPNATFETRSARFANNEVGVKIINANLVSDGSAFENNAVGIEVSGDAATASIRNSDFFGASQATDVLLSDNPTGFEVLDSNFDGDGTAIENTTPGAGDVIATGNFWGDPSGPDDDAGVINGSGARISTGVDAADFIPDPFSPVDSDGDGLFDYQEDANGNGLVDTGETNPALFDSDGDTISDGQEVANGTDPLDIDDPNDQAAPDPQFTTDNDGDGVVAAFDPDDTTNDADGDGITDAFELERGSNPANELDFPPFGDVDNSGGEPDNVDAIVILEAFLGLRDFQSINRAEADINSDDSIDNVDAIILFNFFLGNITYIPFP